VILSPNACVAQHAYGCVVMVYPDGIWYRIREFADAERILEEHVLGGRPVLDLVHRRLNPPVARGVSPPAAAGATGGSAA
jgi:(2Fe-2S) ferredoxin